MLTELRRSSMKIFRGFYGILTRIANHLIMFTDPMAILPSLRRLEKVMDFCEQRVLPTVSLKSSLIVSHGYVADLPLS